MPQGHSTDEPSEIVVDDDVECDSPRAPGAAIVTSGQGNLEQYAAEVAASHLDAALKTLTEVMRAPNRNAQVRLLAAKEIINIALKRAPQAEGKLNAKVVLVDARRAAEVLAKRLGNDAEG